MAWEGVEVELRAPPPAMGSEVDLDDDDLDGPLELGTVLYLVEREEGSRATAIPIAQISGNAYHPLPAEPETPNFVERFELNRWERGSELILLADGREVGTFVTDGRSEPDHSTCLVRPRTGGYLELRLEASGHDRFLALEREGLSGPRRPEEMPAPFEDATFEARAINMVERALLELEAPWPPSVPEARKEQREFTFGPRGLPALAATVVFEDELEVGAPGPLSYGLLVLGMAVNGSYVPFMTWYQRSEEEGKALPRLVELHDLRGTNSPDLLLEVFGEAERWFALAGALGESWDLLYQDPCGVPAASGAIQSYP